MSDRVYDLSQLEELAGGSGEFVQSMVETFLEHTPVQLQELIEAYNRKDIPTMGAIAHKIKPNIDLFGIGMIHQEIRAIEALGKAGKDDILLRDHIGKVRVTLETAFEQLRQLK